MKQKHTAIGMVAGFLLIIIGGLLTLPQIAILTGIGIVVIVIGFVMLAAVSFWEDFRP